MRMAESVVDASVSSVLGTTGRAAVPPAPSPPAPAGGAVGTPAPAAEAPTLRVTAPAPDGQAPALTVTAPAPNGQAPTPKVTAPAPNGQAPTLTVTAPAPRPAPVPVPVPHFAAERPPAGELLVPVPREAAREVTERALAAEPVVPGWDELSLGSIRARLRRLSEEDLVALHDYEENHAARPDVLSMLQNRLTKVRSGN
jgi:hypothetical protein